MGGFLSLGCFCIWFYIFAIEVSNVFYGNKAELSSVMITNDIAKNEELIQLKEYGISQNTIKVGVNIKDEKEFDNEANKYFVYRAYVIDNDHEVK